MREPGRENGSGRTRATVICFDFANTMRAASMSVNKDLRAKAASLSLVAARSTGVNLYEGIAGRRSRRLMAVSSREQGVDAGDGERRRVFVHHALIFVDGSALPVVRRIAGVRKQR